MTGEHKRGAILVAERLTARAMLRTFVEPLTLVLALSLGVLGILVGWQAHGSAQPPGARPIPMALSTQLTHPPAAAEAYVDALCQRDLAYLQRNTGESTGPMPWEPRLTEWAMPCSRHRYLGAVVDRLGRDQYVFTLVRPDGTEVLYVVTFGHDGLVAGVD